MWFGLLPTGSTLDPRNGSLVNRNKIQTSNNFLNSITDMVDSAAILANLNNPDYVAKNYPYLLPYNDNTLRSTPSNRSNVTVTYNGKEYPVYSILGKYYRSDGKTLTEITDKKVTNKIFKDETEGNNTHYNINLTPDYRAQTKKITPTKTGTGSGSGGGGVPDYITNQLSSQQKTIDRLTNQIADLTRVRSADELAAIHDIDVDYNSHLKRYNEATNKYYDSATAEQEKLRTDYLQDNSQFARNLVDSYIDSYRNLAPTPARGVAAAINTMRANQMANDIVSREDYKMLQAKNFLEEQRKAELANNPMLAKEYEENIRKYLSSLSANLNTSDVKAGVASLDNYARTYAAQRKIDAANAAAAATRYSGLAQAATTNANTAASTYGNAANTFKRLQDYYFQTTPNAGWQGASTSVRNNTLGSRNYYG